MRFELDSCLSNSSANKSIKIFSAENAMIFRRTKNENTLETVTRNVNLNFFASDMTCTVASDVIYKAVLWT